MTFKLDPLAPNGLSRAPKAPVITGVSATTTSSPSYTEFIFDSTGTQSGNQYNTWSDLYTAITAVNGYKRITFTKTTKDGTYGFFNEFIPAGTYNLDNVAMRGTGVSAAAGGVVLGLNDGVVVSSWKNKSLDSIGWVSLSTSAVQTISSDFTANLYNGSLEWSVGALGAAAMYSQSAGTLQFNTSNGSSLFGPAFGGGLGGALIAKTGGTTIMVAGDNNCSLDDGLVTGSGGSRQRIVGSGSADPAAASNTDSGYSGTKSIDKLPKESNARPWAKTLSNSGATPTIDITQYNLFVIRALSVDITSFTTNLVGTPMDGQIITFRIKDNGTSRNLTWGASFVDYGAGLPTATTINKNHTVRFMYDGIAVKWGCIANLIEV